MGEPAWEGVGGAVVGGVDAEGDEHPPSRSARAAGSFMVGPSIAGVAARGHHETTRPACGGAKLPPMAAKKTTRTTTKKTATKKPAKKKPAAGKTAANKPAAGKTAARKAVTKKTSTTKASAWSSHPVIATSPANLKHLERLRRLCLALPSTDEASNHGRPCFRVGKKSFVMFMDNHHRDGRLALWCKAPAGAQRMIVEGDPERYFVPPYVGPRGWIGARLDRKPDWTAIRALVEESYAMTAPKRARAAR
jgi:hypothetical protein